MSRLGPEARDLIETASRHEALPSKKRLASVRAAVVAHAALGGVAVSATSATVWAKGVAWLTTGVGAAVTCAAVGAAVGGAVLVAESTGDARSTVRATAASATPTPATPTLAVAEPRPAPEPEADVIAEPRPMAEPAVEGSPPPLAAPPAPSAPRREAAPVAHVPEPSVTPAVARPEPAATSFANDAAREVAPSAQQPGAGDLGNPAPERAESLPRQVEALRAMRAAVARHDGARAISLYRESASWFEGRALEPEARAALVAALCQVGRTDEARRESERLKQAFPSSPLAHRLASNCGRAATESH